MQMNPHMTSALTGVFLLGAMGSCDAESATEGEKDRTIRLLQQQLTKSNRQYATLAKDIAATKRRENELSKNLSDLKLRFAALGDNLLNGGDDKILEAVKNAEVLDKQNKAIEKAAFKMMGDLREYLRTAIIADADARLELETSIRELDVALRIRQNPRPQIALGSLYQAKIVSIDAESGVVVINAGENQSVNLGMTFTILRGNRKVAEAIVSETREDFSGILPTQFDDETDQIRLGDIASIQTEQR